MQKHLEIEFKTYISKEQYENLLEKFNLNDKVFKQTNYYFDDSNFSLLKEKKKKAKVEIMNQAYI